MFGTDFFNTLFRKVSGDDRMNSGSNSKLVCDTMSEISDDNGYILSVRDENKLSKDFYIPEEILALILSYVPYNDLVYRCRLVCLSWKTVVESSALRQKAERENALKLKEVVINRDKKKIILPWYSYYLTCYKNIFGRNLLRNNCGQEKFKYWNILSNGGNKWVVEREPAGSDPLPDNCDDFDGHTSCFATSYHSNSKSQIIDLKTKGFSSKLMDEIQPVIKISEWFAGRFDCGCVYELKVALLDEKKRPITDFEQRETINQWEGRMWKKVEHEFSKYGPGVRYICFYHGGMDTHFWAGHYGSKMAGGVVKLYYDPQS